MLAAASAEPLSCAGLRTGLANLVKRDTCRAAGMNAPRAEQFSRARVQTGAAFHGCKGDSLQVIRSLQGLTLSKSSLRLGSDDDPDLVIKLQHAAVRPGAAASSAR
eukprot:3199647-Prymnesium_polylepis.1